MSEAAKQKPAFSDEVIDGYVPARRANGLLPLHVERDTDYQRLTQAPITAAVRQRAIVEAAAEADSMTAVVERDDRNDDDIQLPGAAQRLARDGGFGNAVTIVARHAAQRLRCESKGVFAADDR